MKFEKNLAVAAALLAGLLIGAGCSKQEEPPPQKPAAVTQATAELPELAQNKMYETNRPPELLPSPEPFFELSEEPPPPAPKEAEAGEAPSGD